MQRRTARKARRPETRAGWTIAVAEAAQGSMRLPMVDYATLSAPFDGVVSRRNINPGDFIKPPTAVEETPLYVVQHRDLMRRLRGSARSRCRVGQNRDSTQIRIPILKDRQYCGKVTTVMLLFSETTTRRLLLAEIDLPEPRRPPAARYVRLCGYPGRADECPDLAGLGRAGHPRKCQRRLSGLLFPPRRTARSGTRSSRWVLAAMSGCKS